jgi:hypothetical protein
MVIAVGFEDGFSKVLDGCAAEEVEDPTTVQCRFCLAEAKGPRETWCCEARRDYFTTKVLCGEHPVFTGK